MSQIAAIVSSFFLALVLCGHASAAGVFDGSSHLYVEDPIIDGETAGTPDYPVLIWAWIKTDNLTANQTFWKVQGPSSNYLGGDYLGANTGQPLRCLHRGPDGNRSSQQTEVVPNDEWLLVAGQYHSSNQRILWYGTGSVSTSGLTGTNGLAETFVGTWDGEQSFLSGKMAEVGFAAGLDGNDIPGIVAALNSGTRPIDIPELAPHIKAYQPLRTGLNDSGYIGPSWDNEGVTFDAGDHPIEYSSPGAKYMILRRQSQ